jgi:cell division protein FtsN
MRIAPVWVLLSGLGFLCVILLLSWVSKPASSLMADASPSASGGPKTEATNQSRVPATPALTASVNSAPKPAETAPAEGRGAKARAEGEAEAATAAQQTGAVEGGGSFTAQVGSYRDAANAEERVAALRAAGLEARAVEAEIPGRGTWHRVQCGRFGTREEAARFGARLRAKGVAREVIITEVQGQ